MDVIGHEVDLGVLLCGGERSRTGQCEKGGIVVAVAGSVEGTKPKIEVGVEFQCEMEKGLGRQECGQTKENQ